MKLKSYMKYKRLSLILSVAGLMCLLNACTSNNESGVVEDFSVNEIIDENQSSKTSTEQSQVSADASSNQSQTSSDESSEQAQTSADANNNQSNATSKENAEPCSLPRASGQGSNASSKESAESWPLSMEESYMSILLADGVFISTDLRRESNLGAIKEVVTDDDSVSVAASKFAIADLDGDGEAEIVLWLQINGISDYGFEILQYREGAVYGYTLPYRAFMDLKTDGTFLFSGGSADSGVGKLEFSENGYTVDKLHESDSDNAMRLQEEKSDVEWYDLSVDGVNTAFEKMF